MGILTNDIISIVENFRKQGEVKPLDMARLTQLSDIVDDYAIRNNL